MLLGHIKKYQPLAGRVNSVVLACVSMYNIFKELTIRASVRNNGTDIF
jgi:hypothetical protein